MRRDVAARTISATCLFPQWFGRTVAAWVIVAPRICLLIKLSRLTLIQDTVIFARRYLDVKSRACLSEAGEGSSSARMKKKRPSKTCRWK